MLGRMSQRRTRTLASGARLGLAASALCLLGGCLDLIDLEPEPGARQERVCLNIDSAPTVEVSYAVDLLPIIQRDRMRAGCNCHDPSATDPQGFNLVQLDLTNVQSLLNGGANGGARDVVPGDPCGSFLIQKISGAPPFGSRMPLSGPPYLSDAERQLFHDWILEGARDN